MFRCIVHLIYTKKKWQTSFSLMLNIRFSLSFTRSAHNFNLLARRLFIYDNKEKQKNSVYYGLI